MIVGTGNVGASIAFALANRHTAVREIVLTDIAAQDAEGEAMDLSDALSVSPSYIKIYNGTYADARDCDIVILTAGAPQKPGESRLDLVQKNSEITKSIVGQIMQSGFNGIFIVVANPMDILTFFTYHFSKLPAGQVIGTGTTLDTSRLQFRLASFLNVNMRAIHAYQIVEHVDSEFTAWSLANMGGQKITSLLPFETLEGIEEHVKKEAYDIIEKKGATYYGIAACVVQIVESILNDEHQVFCVSNFDPNSGVYYGYPAIVGRKGIERRLNLSLSNGERVKLQKSINVIRSTITETIEHSYTSKTKKINKKNEEK
jgi:L-lactate dehydrogenase